VALAAIEALSGSRPNAIRSSEPCYPKHVPNTRRRFSQEFKDELCQEVITTSKTIKDVAVAYGVGPETLRNWVNKYRETHGGTETEVTLDERARLKELERENSELRAETAFLKKAALDSNRQCNRAA